MTLKKYVGIFLWATAFALAFRFFVLEDYRIDSVSMFPALHKGDLLFVAKARYGLNLPFSTYPILHFRDPKPGEVVAFVLPEQDWATFVKRVVAVEGDEVAIKQGLLHVNGKTVGYPADPIGDGAEETPSPPGETPVRWEVTGGTRYPIVWDPEKIPDYGPVQVPKGHFFVLGDNRPSSVDSRSWGPVPNTCVKGKVSFIWLSLGPDGVRLDRTGRWVRS